MSRRLTILQLVPRLKPEICGVGDYALELARALRDSHGIGSKFLVADPAWRHGTTLDGFDVAVLPSRTAASLAHAVAASGCDALVVQYSGYGFSNRGAPLWLARALRNLCVNLPDVHLITMFHELYATGPAWRSSFWLSYPQRRIARSIAQVSHHVRTNRRASARWLERAAPKHRGRITVQPVFSNLGECPNAPPVSTRPPHLVVFGHQMINAPDLWRRLQTIVGALRAEQVSMLNRPLTPPASWPEGVPIILHGILSADAVSAVLRTARWGCINYAPAFLGKSGVLAAMMAHGIVPVLLDEGGTPEEGLEIGRHLLVEGALEGGADLPTLDFMSAAGKAWYATHDVCTTAACYARHLTQRTAATPI